MKLANNQQPVQFISGSNDNDCILWNISEENPCLNKLKGHTGGVTVVESITSGSGKLTIATGSADSTIRLWHKVDGEFKDFQILNLKNGFCFAIRMCALPNTDTILMAVATDDDKIHLYCDTVNEAGARAFMKIETLLGHEDWVRGLDFVNDGNMNKPYS